MESIINNIWSFVSRAFNSKIHADIKYLHEYITNRPDLSRISLTLTRLDRFNTELWIEVDVSGITRTMMLKAKGIDTGRWISHPIGKLALHKNLKNVVIDRYKNSSGKPELLLSYEEITDKNPNGGYTLFRDHKPTDETL